MASAPEDVSVLEAELTCPVCLDLYREPHLLPCGHSFCLPCLKKLKNRGERGHLSCPECRQTHRRSAPWQKNFKLASIADGFRRRGRGQGRGRGRGRGRGADQHPHHQERLGSSQGSAEVCCDYCPPGDPSEAQRAAKTCLKCEVSMCAEHLRPHMERLAFREHPLVEPLSDLSERKCGEHDEMFRYYCADERRFLCNACTIEGGRCGHTLKTIKNATKDLKASLDPQMQKLEKKMRRAEKNLQDHKEASQQSRALVEEAERRIEVLREVLSSRLDRFFSSLSECVRSQEEQHRLSLQQDLVQIREDRSRLSTIHTGLERLLQESDPFSFIKEYNSCAKRYRMLLRMPLFVPPCMALDLGTLSEALGEKLDKFVSELRQNVSTFIDSLCAGEEGDEGVQEDEDGSEEMEDEDEEEMQSEEEEEQDQSDTDDEDDEEYISEDEEEDE